MCVCVWVRVGLAKLAMKDGGLVVETKHQTSLAVTWLTVTRTRSWGARGGGGSIHDGPAR